MISTTKKEAVAPTTAQRDISTWNKDTKTIGQISLEDFKEWYELGLHPLPLAWGNGKADIHPDWKTDTKNNHDFTDIHRWYEKLLSDGRKVNGVAFLMRDPIAMLDFDLKNTNDDQVFNKWFNAIAAVNPDILRKLCIEKTKSSGYHVYFKKRGLTVKKKLASSETGSEVISIYTGGLLSYAAPTPGYSIIHNEMQDVEELTDDEFDLITSMAMVHDQYQSKEFNLSAVIDYPLEVKALATRFDYECKDEIFEDLLSGYNLYPTGSSGTIRQYNITYEKYKREGSTAPFSAKVFHDKKRVYVFSGSYTNIPTFHNRTDDKDKSWSLTPTLLIYYQENDWNKTIEKIKKLLGNEIAGIPTVQYCGFWTNDYKTANISLSTGVLRDFLVKEMGFYLMDGEYVQVIDGVVYKREKSYLYNIIINLVCAHEVSFKIKKADADMIVTIDKNGLATRAQKELRGNVGIIALPELDKEFLRDTANEIFLHFKNGSIRITENGFEQFEKMEKVIWENQVINHELSEWDYKDPVYKEYLLNVAGDNWKSFFSATGYAMRNYNGSDGMKAIWACDEQFETGKNNGRTGKSLFTKALGKVRKMDDCSGKDYNPENQFKHQNIDRDTQIYTVDDVKPYFDFPSLYNYITEGVEINKKHRDRIKLSLQETPKLIITSNYPPAIEQGASTTGRLFILPFRSYYMKYADDGGIKACHGHVFFDDWDQLEWNRFYWFMMDCAQRFLQEGLIKPNMVGIKQNRLKSICYKKLKNSEQANDFADWIYNYQIPEEFQLSEAMEAFKEVNEGEVEKQAFADCLKSYFEIEGVSFTKPRVNIDDPEHPGKKKKVTVWKIQP
jgi:hypothetical protein